MKFDYSGIPNAAGSSAPWTWRPIVPLDVFKAQERITVTGLLDSGADHVLLNVQIAEAIGIDLADCHEGYTMGIDGKRRPMYRTELDIQIAHLERITIPAAFVEGLPVACLLGQVGFFDAYRIKFERDHKVFELTPVKKR